MKDPRAAFSLIELMVVVAIIGILAVVAMPNYQKFQARARQTSAKTELAGIFTAEKSFYAEYGTYHNHLPLIGFVPEGIANQAGAPCGLGYGTVQGARRSYGSYVGDPAAGNPPFVSAAELGLSYPNQAYNVFSGYGASPGLCDTLTNYANGCIGLSGATAGLPAAVNSQHNFEARAAGCPRRNLIEGQIADSDVWSIDHLRNLRNLRSGI